MNIPNESVQNITHQ